MNPLITVIVPIYNVEKYLNKCVESILNQTYKNLEIILVDDGSPDNCPEMCDNLAKKDSRIKVIHKENGGLSSARNAGLDIMTGEYVIFIDSDDYFELNALEVLYNAVVDNNCDMAVGRYVMVYDNEPDKTEFTDKVYLYTKSEYIRSFSIGLNNQLAVNMIISCCKLCKKNVFSDVRFPLNKIREDEFVIHKICNNCNKIVLVDECLYYYVQRTDSIMSSETIKSVRDYAEAMFDRTEFILHNSYDADAVNAVLFYVMSYIVRWYFDIKYDYNENEFAGRLKKYYKKIYKIAIKNKIYTESYYKKNKNLFDSFYLNEYLFRFVRKIKRIKN